MNNQLQEDIAETEPFLEKSSGRKNRRDKSAKKKLQKSHRQDRRDREYEDGFEGNYN